MHFGDQIGEAGDVLREVHLGQGGPVDGALFGAQFLIDDVLRDEEDLLDMFAVKEELVLLLEALCDAVEAERLVLLHDEVLDLVVDEDDLAEVLLEEGLDLGVVVLALQLLQQVVEEQLLELLVLHLASALLLDFETEIFHEAGQALVDQVDDLVRDVQDLVFAAAHGLPQPLLGRPDVARQQRDQAVQHDAEELAHQRLLVFLQLEP